MQILNTKLSIPPLRARSVPRMRLIQKLNQGLECNFILVSAPAGYGKSTLLSAWLEQLGFPSAWLSLDDNDNDLSRFLEYLAAACHEIDPSIPLDFYSSADTHAHPEIDTLLTPLINRLAQSPRPFCLVFDDYHVIQEQAVHQAVIFLLERHPEPLHLVIATRSDPPLPLARSRARSEMLEIRMADLRFTEQEAADFLRHTMGINITSEDVIRIAQRTEGWIAGLQMAALSMQDLADLSGFINAFTGSHHYIFDYLLEEILGKQTPEIHRFLLYTSILDHLNASLCDALLDPGGQPASPGTSAGILDQLEHANLFIIAIDHNQHWYRYHPLFAELLRGYLQKKEPGQARVLHTRASVWFEQQGMISQAIRHSFAVSDWERSVRLISGNIFALLEQNELTGVARQLEKLSGERTAARPWLLLAHAWVVAYTGQVSAVEPVLKEAETEIDSLKSELELQTLGGHIAAIRAYSNWIGDNREVAARAAEVALEWLPASERLIRCQAATLLGLSLDDFNARAKALQQALAYARECSVSHVTIFAHGCWAWLLAMQGRLHDAHTACLEVIQLVQSSGSHASIPSMSHVYTTLGAVLLEWNDVEGALYYSKQAVDLARRWEQADALHFALDNYGYALFASGDVDSAFDIQRQAWQVARRTSSWFQQITLSQEVEWHLSLNDLDAALHALHQAKVDTDAPVMARTDSYQSLLLPLCFVQIYLAQRKYSKALEYSQILLEDMEKRGVGHFHIRLLIWQSLAHRGLGQEEEALHSLKSAIKHASPEGYLRVFLIEGKALLPILKDARKGGIYSEYIDRILDALKRNGISMTNSPAAVPGLVEQLSGREMEVLRLLAQGCSDKKIALTLVIAPETVHKHLKNIYGKLDVHNRTEAVSRSHELGLI